MESSDFITFYHVTFQGNLKSIKNTGALITIGDPTNIGVGNTMEHQGYLENSEGRVFATTEWQTVIRYINDVKERAERMGNEGILKYLVVLKITIPLVEFNVLFSRKPEESSTGDATFTGGACAASDGLYPESYYFTSNYEPSISIQYLSIAVSRIYRLNTNRAGEYQFGKNWWWMTVKEFEFQEGIYPVVPDTPFPRSTTSIDINQIVHNAVMAELNKS